MSVNKCMRSCELYASAIKKKYQNGFINYKNRWSSCHTNKEIRLEEEYKRTPITYSDLFKVQAGKSPVRKVCVTGTAGIGKTTLCILISKDWANGELFQQFDLVILLPLRMKKVTSVHSLCDLLRLLHCDDILCHDLDCAIKRNEGKGLLIIADGWDDLSEDQQKEDSFIYQLLFKKYPSMSVLVTSRSFVFRKCDLKVELVGYSKKQATKYILSAFDSQPEEANILLEQLENNPLIKSLCNVPLSCAIVCHMWHALKQEPFPTTMTEFYTRVVLNIIQSSVKTNSTTSTLSSFDILPTELHQQLLQICESAFEAMHRLNQFVFSGNSSVISNNFESSFGLLQSVESNFGTYQEISYHFLHVNLQEYLAALYLAEQPPDRVFNVLYTCNKQWSMLNRFYFGIVSKKETNSDAIGIISQILSHKFLWFEIETFFIDIHRAKAIYPRYEVNWQLHAWYCAFEAKNVDLNSIVHSNLLLPDNMRSQCSWLEIEPKTAYDLAAVLYSIANMEGDDDMEIHIHVAICDYVEKQLKTLSDLLKQKGNLLISYMHLSGNRLTVTGLQILESAVRYKLLERLEVLCLKRTLTSDAGINGAWITNFGEALAVFCPKLRLFDISENILGVPGASAFAQVLSKISCSNGVYISCYIKRLPCFLSDLNFTKTNLCDDGLNTFTMNVNCPCYLNEILLCDNDIHAAGISSLADAVCSGKIMIQSELNLSNNPIKLKGTVSVGKLLSSYHCKPEKVDLSRCELTASDDLSDIDSLFNNAFIKKNLAIGQQLCEMAQNSTIMYLYLNGNNFTGESIHILAGFICLCPCLKRFDTKYCNITSDDLTRILDRLSDLKLSSTSFFSCLESWSLKGNQIDDRGVSAVIHYLPLHSWLRKLDFIDHNLVSKEVKERFSEKIKIVDKV